MNYSQAGIANVALGRIGARGQLVSLNDNSPNAIKVLAVWDTVFQEVLSERDWKFAKIRVQLSLSPQVPAYGYNFAWAMPSDFLRFIRPHKRPRDRWGWFFQALPVGTGWYLLADAPFVPTGFAYVVETLPVDGNRYLLTNYDGSLGPAFINYIKLISDYTQLMPGFVNCLAWRLAKELALNITEDKQKFELCEDQYKQSLNSAEAQNECMDLISYDEQGSTSWEDAGRCVRFW